MAKNSTLTSSKEQEVLKMTIGERLTELRKSRGLSQEELAEQLTLTRQTISKWELGGSLR